jgi:hypothetical protein
LPCAAAAARRAPPRRRRRQKIEFAKRARARARAGPCPARSPCSRPRTRPPLGPFEPHGPGLLAARLCGRSARVLRRAGRWRLAFTLPRPRGAEPRALMHKAPSVAMAESDEEEAEAAGVRAACCRCPSWGPARPAHTSPPPPLPGKGDRCARPERAQGGWTAGCASRGGGRGGRDGEVKGGHKARGENGRGGAAAHAHLPHLPQGGQHLPAYASCLPARIVA